MLSNPHPRRAARGFFYCGLLIAALAASLGHCFSPLFDTAVCCSSALVASVCRSCSRPLLNEYGRVDVWSEKCLPPGTVHLRLPRLVPVARRLGIDFANAMVGFEFRNGRSYPVHEGIVVCTEFRDAIMEAYAEEEEMREAEERRKNETDALSRWFQLLSSIVTRQRLENSYAGSSAVNSSCDPPSNPCGHRDGSRSFRAEVLGGDKVEVNRPPSRDHEHVFSWESRSSDEDGTVRTKRCTCGFSVQVEELRPVLVLIRLDAVTRMHQTQIAGVDS
ncbi:hypothetical protein KSP40_PGU003221 [Platanthera guangdongensis]|uniref:Rad4 beta-hairpin domain-containing protein n=1 Tax=Platanthera guangdongensis TaxID=2320717 RepID=A0ABR2LKZ7_9ASPA